MGRNDSGLIGKGTEIVTSIMEELWDITLANETMGYFYREALDIVKSTDEECLQLSVSTPKDLSQGNLSMYALNY